MKILLVDDEPAVLGFLKLLFDDAGYETICAADGLAGLRAFLKSRPDVAIIDILMPNMDGIELCSRIREISRIPVVMLTAVERVGDRISAFQVGADDYVTKPVSGRELVARIEARLRRTNWHGATDTPVLSVSQSALAQPPGHASSLERLLATMWGPVYHPLEMVKWHPSDLRN